MKRVLTFLAIMLLPLSVWAMTPVSDSDLSNVTGQAGVNINADLTMDIAIGTMAWGDGDGITGVVNPWTTVGAGGYIGMNNFAINNLQIRARYETADHYNSYHTVFLKPITIDVATGTKTVSAGVTDTRTFVRFGLGALKITMDQLQFDISLATRSQLNTNGTLDQNMGRVTLGAMEIYINPWSYVDIYSHAGSGVNFDLNITIDRFAMNYMSWGDTDGLPAGNPQPTGAPTGQNWINASTAAGYVGLDNFLMGDATHPAIVMTGVVAIDVVTSAHGVYADLQRLQELLAADHCPVTAGEAAILAWMSAAGLDALPASYNLQQIFAAVDTMHSYPVGTLYATVTPKTVVHISFPTDFNLTIAKMTGDVVLGNTADFGNITPGTTYTQTLGDIYIQGLGLTINQGSWVDIWAH